ncbi:MAG: 2-C-methyl-D-erythritol 4-phosphate cytidylyltransferase [Fusobacteria bacterium]|nr:2-C-methyl-D-erythritol 4-phosphate cytidylyltransferase [Fusobacteriota bacterium]
MNLSVIVALAGQGKRMNCSVPKQFLEFIGRPLFIYTLEEIEKSPCVSEIILVTRSEYIEYLNAMVEKYQLKKVNKIVEGGTERQDSIENGIKVVDENADFIAVQDGVRPLVKASYFDKSIEILEKNEKLDGVVVGVQAKDTIKIVNASGMIEATPNRNTIFHAQTPQTFKKSTLKKAYSSARDSNFIGTDDASVVEKFGGHVSILEGEYENIKITTLGDLDIFKKFKETRDESKS